jgi:hypothetical protein
MRTDFDRDRTTAALLREGLALAGHGALYGFGLLPSRHRPCRARDLRTTVFVHGLLANRASFFPLQGFLRVLGHRTQYSFNYRRERSIEAMAVSLRRRLDAEVRGGRIDLVCHSMGGLVARFYLQVLGGHRRVDRLITLATPHHGTHSSVYVPTPLLSQLAPESPFLRHLNALTPPPGVRTTSIVARRDLLVLPATSATAPFGEHVFFDALGHLDLLLAPKVFAAVHRALDAPGPGDDAAP